MPGRGGPGTVPISDRDWVRVSLATVLLFLRLHDSLCVSVRDESDDDSDHDDDTEGDGEIEAVPLGDSPVIVSLLPEPDAVGDADGPVAEADTECVEFGLDAPSTAVGDTTSAARTTPTSATTCIVVAAY